jgi:hypothetical protein
MQLTAPARWSATADLGVGRTFEWQDGGGPSESRGHPRGSSAVVVPLATVETPRADAAVLETDAQNRRGTGHCGPASRGAPCRRARRAVRVARAFRTDIPFLRLLLGSKGVEVVEVISLASHGSLPRLVQVGLECARVSAARPMAPPPNDALQLTTHGQKGASQLNAVLSGLRRDERCGTSPYLQ